jgi:hypothetical protein
MTCASLLATQSVMPPELAKLQRLDRYNLTLAVVRRVEALRGYLRLSVPEMSRLMEVDPPSYRHWLKSTPEKFSKPGDMPLRLLVLRVPGLSLDWLYLGREASLSPELQFALSR